MQQCSSKTAHQRYREGALRQVGTMIGILTTGVLHKSLTIAFSAARCSMLPDRWWRVDDSASNVAQIARWCSGDQFVTVYKETGNGAAKGHLQALYAESTPAWYWHFTVIKVATQVL